MPQEKDNAVTNFLNEVQEQKPDVFEEKDVATEEEVTEEEKDEKPLPFHKDPKVQRYVEKQIEKALKDVKPSAETTFRKELSADVNLPESFVKLIGNDTEEKRQVLKDMSDYLSTIPKKAQEQFIEAQRQEAQKQIEADKQAEEELDTYFDEIEETFNVDLSSNSASAKKSRSEFIDYVRKIAPKNEDGEVAAYPDLVAAFEEFQEKGKRLPNNSRAKDLAQRGMTRSTDTTTAMPTGRSWKDVDRFFSKLRSDN